MGALYVSPCPHDIEKKPEKTKVTIIREVMILQERSEKRTAHRRFP
jgi:hypothetical protein